MVLSTSPAEIEDASSDDCDYNELCLRDAIFTGVTNLSFNAGLSVDLTGANFAGVDFTDVEFPDSTNFTNVD